MAKVTLKVMINDPHLHGQTEFRWLLILSGQNDF